MLRFVTVFLLLLFFLFLLLLFFHHTHIPIQELTKLGGLKSAVLKSRSGDRDEPSSATSTQTLMQPKYQYQVCVYGVWCMVYGVCVEMFKKEIVFTSVLFIYLFPRVSSC